MTPGENVIGLPEFRVLLTGAVDSPTIMNRSDRSVLGYVLRFEDEAGRVLVRRIFRSVSMHNDADPSIPPGGARQFSASTHHITEFRFPGQNTPSVFQRVALDAVLFADGELAGPDRSSAFGDLAARAKGERELHERLLEAKDGPREQKDRFWSEVLALSKGSSSVLGRTTAETEYLRAQHRAAAALFVARDVHGDAAAYDLAARSRAHPEIWRRT